ncbi:C40 family peptidase [Streptomyces sp. NPDC059083]|uniref:C40 family peptidase n=1 Tax=Streptomyces sp. NPDC059083 TaxID=3346721 RepID=UPI003686D1DE
MTTTLTGDLHDVLGALLGLYGSGRPEGAQSTPASKTIADSSALTGATSVGYTDAHAIPLLIADAHARREEIVEQAVAQSGGNTLEGRNRLTNQIADLQSRVQAIAVVGDTRFGGPALLDAAQIAITNAAKQVDADTVAARALAARIAPLSLPKMITNSRTAPRRPRSRLRSRRRRTAPSDATSGGNAVRAATGWLGTPYVWGGGGIGGPSSGGFDCSGLTQYAIAQASDGRVVLPRTTYEQIYSGSRVPVQDVRPGDLVFPASSFGRHGPEHVQLAAGNGMVIEAPNSGSTVKWSRMPRNAIVVRVL